MSNETAMANHDGTAEGLHRQDPTRSRFDTKVAPSPGTAPNQLYPTARPTQPLEPILFPKLRI